MVDFVTVIDDDEVIKVPFGETTISVRRMPPDTQDQFRRRYTKTRFHQGQKHEDINFNQFKNAVLEWGVRDWEGVKNPRTHEDVPLSPEALRKLPPKVQEKLAAVILDRQDELLGEEIAEGNFESSSGASGTSPSSIAGPATD